MISSPSINLVLREGSVISVSILNSANILPLGFVSLISFIKMAIESELLLPLNVAVSRKDEIKS